MKSGHQEITGDHPVFLGISEVSKRIGVCGASIHKMEGAGEFPVGLYVTPRKKVWLESEIITWQLMKVAEARA